MLKKLIFFIIFFLSLLVRVLKMEYIPFQNDGDELAFVFTGLSLFDKKMPMSWSSFKYDSKHTLEKVTLGDKEHNTKEEFTMVGPWFDNPFILSFIQGAWLKALGFKFPSAPPSLIIRIPMIFFSAITLFLIFDIAKTVFGFWPGLFSLTLIGFSPIFIFSNRMVATENIYTPILLFILRKLIKNKNYSKKDIILIGVLNIIAILTKFPAIMITIIVASLFFKQNKIKLAIFYSLSVILASASIYLFYVSLFDFNHFLNTLHNQANRLSGWQNPIFLLTHPGFLNFTIDDLSYYLILFFGLSIFREKSDSKNKKAIFLLKVSIITSFFIIWASSGEKDMLGWYKIPLFTILTISSANFLSNAKSYFYAGFFILICFFNNLGLLKTPEKMYPDPLLLRTVIVILFASFVLFEKINKKNIQKSFLVLALLFYIGQGFYINLYFYNTICKDKACKIPTLTIKELILRKK